MFGASRQVYYRAVKAQARRRELAQQVLEMVREVRLQMPRLGTRKLYHILHPRLNSLGVGRDRLFAILKANHMLIKPKRQYHITTNSYHRFRKHKNLIEDHEISKPEEVWVSDITYVGTRSNPMYLALVTDAYSKRIMGYNVSDSLHTTGALNALKMALTKRDYKHPLTHHSDRGFQYCSHEYQKMLQHSKVKCSMTESYDPYANAVAERINGILKHEFLIQDKKPALPIMKLLIANSIETYNHVRPHLSNHMLTPQRMHQQKELKIKTYKNKNRDRYKPAPV